MNHVYNNELKKCMLFQMLLRDNLMSHLTLRGDKKCFCLNLMAGRTFGTKKIGWQMSRHGKKKNITPNFLPICDMHGMERPKNASTKCHVMAH